MKQANIEKISDILTSMILFPPMFMAPIGFLMGDLVPNIYTPWTISSMVVLLFVLASLIQKWHRQLEKSGSRKLIFFRTAVILIYAGLVSWLLAISPGAEVLAPIVGLAGLVFVGLLVNSLKRTRETT
jgi:uncharacterized membrane protein